MSYIQERALAEWCSCGQRLTTQEGLRNEIGKLRAEVERLRSLVKALADDLEDELKGHYSGTLDYPSERRRFERDMANVYEARKALEGK